MAAIEVTHSTRLAAPAEAVWSFATTPAGLNYEFGPLVRMTMPRDFDADSIAEVTPGEPLGRSWLLLAHLIPFEYDDLTIAEVGPGRRFLERSRLGTARSWTHERRVVRIEEGACRLTDTLTLEPRALIRGLRAEPIARAAVNATFAHRHRRLVKRWGAAA